MSESEDNAPAGWQLCVEHEDPRIVVAIAHNVAAQVVATLPLGATVGVDASDALEGKAYVCVPDEPDGLLDEEMLAKAFEYSLLRAVRDTQVGNLWDEIVERVEVVETMIDSGAHAEDVAGYIAQQAVPAVQEACPKQATEVVKRLGDKLQRFDLATFMPILAARLLRQEQTRSVNVN